MADWARPWGVILTLLVASHLGVMCELCAERWATVIMPSGLHLCAPCQKRYLSD
jgi:hypothetical protein